jgi:tetratricopeptide (TPR) repeat protein
MKKLATLILTLTLVSAAVAQQDAGNYLRGRAMMEKQQYDSALIYLDRAVREDPGDVDALYYRGVIRFEQGDFPGAMEDFHTVNRRYRGRGSYMLAKTEVRLGHNELAMKHLRDHLGSTYRRPESEILLDEDLGDLETSPQWKTLWNEKEWYRPFEKELQEAVYMKNNGNELDALNLLNDLGKKGLYASLIHQYKAEIYKNTGNIKASRSEVDRALERDARNMEARKLRIELAMNAGDFELAQSDCKILLRQDPASFNYYILSGIASGKTGNYQEALDNFELYLQLFPGDHNALHQKGVMQKELGKYLDALRSVNKALEIDTGHAEYFATRGEVYAKTGMHRYAVKDFSMALDLNPEDPETWYLKGLSDLELGEKDSACFDFRHAARYGKFEARKYIDELCGQR